SLPRRDAAFVARIQYQAKCGKNSRYCGPATAQIRPLRPISNLGELALAAPSCRTIPATGVCISSAAQHASPVASREKSEGGTITTEIPARLDRLPWSRFHLLVMVALGVTWILDGLEVTIIGAIAPVLQNTQTLGLSAGEIGAAGSS